MGEALPRQGTRGPKKGDPGGGPADAQVGYHREIPERVVQPHFAGEEAFCHNFRKMNEAMRPTPCLK